MWESQIELLKDASVQKISIFSQARRVSYSEVIEWWQHNENFRSFFLSLLASAPFAAYFWETPSISLSTVDREFDFVLADSPQLARVRADSSDFQQHFEAASSGEQVITFPNLGNDARLVVPCPMGNLSAYSHLAAFVREAPQSQQHTLWQIVGKVLKGSLNQHPIWVSTSGLGVYWLHIRLDSFPKYYTFASYK